MNCVEMHLKVQNLMDIVGLPHHCQYHNIDISADIEDCDLILKLNSDEDIGVVKECFYEIWEILAFAFGYFFPCESGKINGEKCKEKDIYKLDIYRTSGIIPSWLFLCNDMTKIICEDTLKKYNEMKNDNQKMNVANINAFFYSISRRYKNILVDDRLRMIITIADGLVINNESQIGDIKAHMSILFRQCPVKLIKENIEELMGISIRKFYDVLSDTRNELSHFTRKPNSVSSLIRDRGERSEVQQKNIVTYLYWYLVFVMYYAIRKKCLLIIGIDTIEDYEIEILNSFRDMVIYGNKLGLPYRSRCYKNIEMRKEFNKRIKKCCK